MSGAAVDDGRPLLEVEDLVVRYSVPRGLSGVLLRRPQRFVHAVSGVSLTVRRGEMVALVGESGCGKTTTAQAILRLVQVESGSVRFDGVDVTTLARDDLRRLRRRMQIIYQDPYESLDPRFRVSTTVAEPLVIHRIGSRAERQAAVSHALERVGLAPAELFVDRFPHELSGGQRQRVAIAASLALEPDLLVADEPVSMLDVSVRAGILAILDELRDRGLAVLMITHDLSTAARFADRICVMYLGRIVEEGPANVVIERPRHPYTKALLSVVPRTRPPTTRHCADPPRRDAQPDRGPLRLPLPSTLSDRDRCVPGKRTGVARRGRRSRPSSRVLPCRLVPAVLLQPPRDRALETSLHAADAHDSFALPQLLGDHVDHDVVGIDVRAQLEPGLGRTVRLRPADRRTGSSRVPSRRRDRWSRRRSRPRTAPGRATPRLRRSRIRARRPRAPRGRGRPARSARPSEAARPIAPGRASPCRTTARTAEAAPPARPRRRGARARWTPGRARGAPAGAAASCSASPSRRARAGCGAPPRTPTRSRRARPRPLRTDRARAARARVEDSRCARFRRPRVTSADVPSGKTSQSFAERYATGTVDVSVAASRGWPRISTSCSNGPHS